MEAVGFFTGKDIPAKTVDSSTYYTFESIATLIQNNLSLRVSLTPGTCLSAFLDDFLLLSGFPPSLTSSIVCGHFNVRVDTNHIYQGKVL